MSIIYIHKYPIRAFAHANDGEWQSVVSLAPRAAAAAPANPTMTVDLVSRPLRGKNLLLHILNLRCGSHRIPHWCCTHGHLSCAGSCAKNTSQKKNQQVFHSEHSPYTGITFTAIQASKQFTARVLVCADTNRGSSNGVGRDDLDHVRRRRARETLIRHLAPRHQVCTKCM